MRAERMAFEAWLIIQAMRRAFTDEQVTDLRMAFGAGWAARSDTEAILPAAEVTSRQGVA
jgi:hypothetical protein